MAVTKYKVNESASIYKEAKSSSKKIGTASKGTTIHVQSVSGGWAKLTKNHSKINNKNVANGYISTSKIKKVSSNSSSKKKNNKHLAHDKSKGKAKVLVNAYIRKKCSDTAFKATGVYFPKGEKLDLIAYCKTNGTAKVKGKASNGAQTTGWVASASVDIKISKLNKFFDNAKNAMTKAARVNTRKQVQATVASIVNNKDVKGNFNSAEYARSVFYKNNTGIYGIPYQFMPSVDYRMTNKVSFGRTFAERIVTRMPIILFTPGKPDFAAQFSKSDRNTIVQALLSVNAKAPIKKLDKLIKSQGRYYTFDFAYKEYWPYVNASCRFSAIVLGIGNVTHTTAGVIHGYQKPKLGSGEKLGGKKKTKLKNYNWSKEVNPTLTSFVNLSKTTGSPEYIAFYLDAENSISESIDNSTTTSSIADTINSASSLSKEVRFLAGPVAGLKIGNLDEATYEKSQKQIKDVANHYLGGSKLIKNMGEMFTTVSRGGHIVFPELWSDSEYTKSYNISIKLRTPDADKISWYLNIQVPLIHLLALAAPHSMGPNGYGSPFMVRAFYKGIFNCDFGLITGMDINKGKEGAWSLDGLPTEVDVSITIKDLYQSLSLTNTTGYKFFQNTALIDYLCTSCGVNINKMEKARIAEAYLAWTTNKFKDFWPSQYLKLHQGLYKLATKAYAKVIKSNYGR